MTSPELSRYFRAEHSRILALVHRSCSCLCGRTRHLLAQKRTGRFIFVAVCQSVASTLSSPDFLPVRQGEQKCFNVQFTVFVGRLPSGGSLQFTRRVIVSDDALCSLNLNCLLENDRREDTHPPQGPRAEQGWGLTGAGRGGCDRDVHRPQDEQQEQSQ